MWVSRGKLQGPSAEDDPPLQLGSKHFLNAYLVDVDTNNYQINTYLYVYICLYVDIYLYYIYQKNS